MVSEQFICQVELDRTSVPDFDQYPFSLNAVRHLERLALHPVDLARNAYARRSRRRRAAPEERQDCPTPPTTASELAFEADFAPLVDADGGYAGDKDDE